MKRTAAFLALLPATVAGLLVSPAPGKPPAKQAPQRGLPAPRGVWHIPGWIPGESTFDGVQTATERTLAVGVTNRRGETVSRRVVVLNRNRENVQRTYEPERINLRDQSIRANWSVLGSVAARRERSVTFPQIIFERQLFFNGSGSYRAETEFYGIDETGRTQWQYPPIKAKTQQPAGVFLYSAPLFGGLLPIRASDSDTLQLWDAQTGVPVDQATPEGKATVATAIRQVGSPLLQTWDKLYRLDTGVALPLPYKVSSSSDEQIVPLGVTADRAFWRAGGDDGFMGHSSWPTYLIASDENGKLLWHFPTAKDADYASGGINAPSASSLTLVNGLGSGAIALVPVGGKAGGLYGLRVRDGKTLWKRILPDLGDVAAPDPKGSGALLLRVRYNLRTMRYENSVLEYLHAATGKTQKAWTLPAGINHIAVAGEDLLTIDGNGKLAIYSCRALLGDSQKIKAGAIK